MSIERLVGGPGVPAVSFEQVSKHYGQVQAVRELTLQLPQGRAVAFLGPNGAGKSTSMEILLGLKHASSGRVEVFGMTPRQAMTGGHVGAMLQSGGLPADISVRELLNLMSQLHPKPLPVDEVMERANIADLADRKAGKLSGGQTQRVRFAVAIAGDSDLIVLDEPTTGMDVENRQVFWNSMKAEAERGKTVLFATHYLEEAVGRRQDDDRHRTVEPVHLRQQLVERLFLLVLSGHRRRATRPAQCVELVDEDDARRGLARLLEHVAHPRGADAHEHLHELGAVGGEERHARLPRHRARQ